MSVDGLHPEPYGGSVVASTMLATAQVAGFVRASAPIAPPSVANLFSYGTTYTSTSAQTTTCTGNTTKNYFFAAPTPAVSTGLYAIGQKLYFQNASLASFSPTVTCLDATNNVVQLNSPAPASITGSVSNWTMMQNDASSMLTNGIIGTSVYSTQANAASPLANTGTPSLGTTVVKAVPYGWTLTVDSGSTTALAAGTLGLSYGIESNPLGDGNDDFVMALQGYAGTGTPAVTLQQVINAGMEATIANGDTHRGQCEVRISAGPNGHLTGLEAVQVKMTNSTTGTFVPPGLASGAYTSWVGSAGGGAVEFSDASVQTGAPGVVSTSLGNQLVLPLLSPPAKIGAAGTLTQNFSVVTSFVAGDPVSATIRVRKCSVGKVTQ